MELVQGGSLFQIVHGERGESYEQVSELWKNIFYTKKKCPGCPVRATRGPECFFWLNVFSQYKNRLPWAQRLRFLLDALYGLRAVHNGVYKNVKKENDALNNKKGTHGVYIVKSTLHVGFIL